MTRPLRSPQRSRRDAYEAAEADARAAVLDRDHRTCVIGGPGCSLAGRRPTFQHRDPRGMGGTTLASTPANGIVLCGSGTTGHHGLVEHEGREQGWAYDLGYLIRSTNGITPADVLVWYAHERVWVELLDSGVCVTRPELMAPAVTLPDLR